MNVFKFVINGKIWQIVFGLPGNLASGSGSSFSACVKEIRLLSVSG